MKTETEKYTMAHDHDGVHLFPFLMIPRTPQNDLESAVSFGPQHGET